ncbi:MAG: phenylalanine--tRNA ligase subunit beta [Streptosporangiaceae bacterium]
MRISLEWISDFVDLPADVEAGDLARELTLKTVEVESLAHTGRALANVVVGRVADLEPLGDKGHVRVLCDVGSGRQAPVVSQARNLRVGDTIAVALPGARLVATSGGAGPRSVATAHVLGVESRGVICTAADLGLQRLFPNSPDGHVLDLAELDAQVGSAFADAIGFNDVVLEIDNKSLTHRPDLWGHYGIARELAAIYGRELKSLPNAALPPRVEGLVGHVDRDLCRRLTVVEFALDGADVSPLWLRSRLARIGESTVNLPVDLSNYVMFAVGQPTHVYDAEGVTLPLSVGRNGAATKLDLLSGESRELAPTTPVILDSVAPVGVAGVMGASDSAVSSSSRRFALEAATFRPVPIRRASQHLALRTEASARFEKGLDTPRVDAAVHLFLHVLDRVAPSVSVTDMQDVCLDPTSPTTVDLDLDFLATRVGQRLDESEVRGILDSLGFAATLDADHLRVVVPTWRSTGDVSLPHDIVEEVARIHGYDNIPVAQLSITLTPVHRLNRRPLDRTMREHLAARAGMQEIVTYPWVADSMLTAAGFSKDDTLRFEGAPAPDRNSLRPSLIPNLLETVAANLRYSQAFSIFEAGAVFAPDRPYVRYHGVSEPLPKQRTMLAVAIVGADGPTLFRQAKGVLQMLRRHCHLTHLQLAETCDAPWADRFTRLGVTADGIDAGVLGLLATRCRRLAGIADVQVACFELDLDHLSPHPSRGNRYEPISELPESDFDLSVVVNDDVPWDQISSTITRDVNDLIHHVSFVDEFRGSWVPDGQKSVTVRITLRPKTSTLTAEHLGEVRREVIATLEQRFGARLRQ